MVKGHTPNSTLSNGCCGDRFTNRKQVSHVVCLNTAGVLGSRGRLGEWTGTEPAVLLSGASLWGGTMGVCPVSLRLWPHLFSAAVVHLPQEVFGENSMHQYPGGLKLGLPGPLPHALAHGFQGTTQFVARFLQRPRQISA